MSYYRLEIKNLSRAHGHCMAAAIAYRHAIRLADETGQVWDFRDKKGVLASGFFTPTGCTIRSAYAFVHAVESAETRKNSRIAKELIKSIPRELSREAAVALAKTEAARYADLGLGVSWALHNTTASDGGGNPHIHFLITTRRFENGALGAKVRELDSKEWLLAERKAWAVACNTELKKLPLLERPEMPLDHRSYDGQGLDKAPAPRLSKSQYLMEKRRKLEAETIRAEYQPIIFKMTARVMIKKLNLGMTTLVKKLHQVEAAARRLLTPPPITKDVIEREAAAVGKELWRVKAKIAAIISGAPDAQPELSRSLLKRAAALSYQCRDLDARAKHAPLRPLTSEELREELDYRARIKKANEEWEREKAGFKV
jgi:hypothetical protein